VGEVVADPAGDGLVEDALVAETLVVELEALEFDAGAAVLGRAGLEADGHHAEIGMPGLGAARGELVGDVFDDEGRVGRGGEDLEELGVGHGDNRGETVRR